MSDSLYEALEACLQALETGADLDTVLMPYPEWAEELRPLLEVSVKAHSLAMPSIPEAAMRRGRSRVLGHAAQMRETAGSSLRPFFSFPRLAASLAMALIFVFVGTGLVRASGGALPGDRLYPVKRTVEDMRLLLVTSPEGREELEDEFEQKRLYEVNELLAEGREERIAFSGVVTQQSGDQWLVSGIPVQIMPDSKLPEEPVTVGASLRLEGRTTPQGFVEADQVFIRMPGIPLPASGPTEAVHPKDENQIDETGREQNDNAHPDEIETETPENENDVSGNDGKDSNENSNSSDDEENSNSGSGGGDETDNDNNGNDNDDNNNDGNDKEDNSGSGSGSGGGDDDNSNEADND